MDSNLYGFVPIIMQIVFSAAFVFGTIFLSRYLGPRRINKRKSENFECGLEPYGDSRLPFPLRYFLVALLFVILDLEVVFMYPWAINYGEFDWSALFKMGGFILLLVIGYLYILKKKALDWDE